MTASAQPTVLLTGATGFLGSRLLRGLLGRHTSVIVLKRSWSDTWRIAELLPDVAVYDVDRTPLPVVFGAHRIDAVIHTATAYGRRGETASGMMETNLVFPMRLLELSASCGAAFFNTDSFSTKGSAVPEGLQYYTLAKKHFREYGATFARASGLRFTNVQVEHVFGPNDNHTKFFPSLIRALLARRATFELTPGEQRRDFVYVDDVVAAYLILLEHHASLPNAVSHVEVGRGRAESLRDAVELVHQLCGSDTRLLFGALPYREGELMESRADTTVLTQLGWSPVVSLREGLERTVRAIRSRPETPEPGAVANSVRR